MKPFNSIIFHLLMIGCIYIQPAVGQVNFLGKPGLMTTPSAEWDGDRQLGLSFAYIPAEYSRDLMITSHSSPEGDVLNLYNARVILTSFMDVGLSIAHRPGLSDQIGIGDRQLDFRFRLLKEGSYYPALVLGWTPPGSVSPVLSHDYLVATKNIFTSFGNFQISTGYGSPYFFAKNQNSEGVFDLLEVRRKTEFFGNRYLTGFFGSLVYRPISFGGLMLEYNTSTINAGAFVKPWEWLQLQAYTFEGNSVAYTFALHFPLDFAPKALRDHEKSPE